MWGDHIQVELEEYRQTKEQQRRSAAFFHTFADSPVTKEMSVKSTESPFARLVAIITVIVHVYNYWTCLFFLGIEGFPTGVWYVLEIAAETHLGLEFIMQICMPYKFKWLWQDMYLLRDSMLVETMPWRKGTRYLINALPYSFIISMVIRDNPVILNSFELALFRLLKLLRFNEVKRFFELFDLQNKKERSYSLNKLFYCVFFLFVYLHAWTMLWLNTGRMDWSADESHGWYALAKFNLGPSWYEMYMESFYYVISTFSGAGFGNIIPTTNYEWFIATLINLVGTCLFSCIFVDFVMEYLLRDLKEFQNAKLFEEIMQFAESTSLPSGLVFKIRYYFNDLNLKFQDFSLKRQIVNDMPENIKGPICIMLNREIIESVKFFQLASPDFITKISILMVPQICLNDDFIVKINDPADKMYFIHSGYVEVLCKNGIDPLVYFGKGDYFGEIGVLVTGTRTVSVKSKTNAVVYYIQKDDLLQLLKLFPEQMSFLKSVAHQRMQTTPFDLGNESDTLTVKTARYSYINQLFEKATVIKLAKQPWFSQQLDSLKLYVLLPLTSIWWFWNMILMTAIMINCLMIPYGLGFNQHYGYNPFIIFSQIVYFLDIPIRARTGILNNYQISIDHQEIFRQYMDKWIIKDLIAFMPFEYALTISGNESIVPYVLLLRLIKFGRLVETFEIIRNNSRHSINAYTYFLDIFGLFFMITHWLACLLAFVGRRELVRNPKFDGNCWFKDMASRVFFQVNGDFLSLSYFDQYKAAVYTCTQIMGGAIYGDSIPQTSLEQTIVSMAFVVCNTLRAFLFVKLAAYYSNTSKGQLIKIRRSASLLQFVKSTNVSKEFLTKVEKFCYQMRHQKDVWEGSECLVHLPLSLQAEIKQYLQESQVQQIKTRPVFQRKVNSEFQIKPDLTAQYERFLKIKKFMDFVDLILVNWNIWFIPLQFSFKIPFTGFLLVIEIITIIFYLITNGFLYHRLSWLHNLDCVKEQTLKRKDLILFQSNYLQQKEAQSIKQKIVIGFIATLPMSWILSGQSLDPYLTVLLCSLRLVKLYPLMKFFRQRQKDQLTGWRIVSTIYFYYAVTNLFANIMILIGIQEDDWTQNWLRRCPVPTPYGTRLDPDYRGDLSPLSIYVHALYYVVSTFSHVAIGDISAVRPNEWVANTCLQWWTWCIYAVLFADITNLVSNIQNQHHKEYSVARADMLKKLKLMPEKLKHDAILYIDLKFKVWQGISEEIVKDLPEEMRVEFLLQKYSKILEQSLLFKVVSTAQTNIALATELLSVMETRVYFDQSYILKVGQQSHFMLILEGNVNLQTISENLGLLNQGDYYGTRLGHYDKTYAETYFRKARLDQPPVLQMAETDNFDNRSVLHFIALKHISIGILSDEILDKLFEKYPVMKLQMLHTNRFLFDVGRKAIEQSLVESKVAITRESCMNRIMEHYTKSDQTIYDDVIRRFRQQRIPNTISNKIKKYYIKTQQKKYRSKLNRTVCRVIKKEKQPFIVCCEQLIIDEESLLNTVITYSTFINRVYITLVLPVQIGFALPTTGGYLYLELISHLLSFLAFLMQFRVPVVQEDGTLTLMFSKVVKNYYSNGMVVDILAFLPINLILPFVVPQDNLLATTCVAPLRIMRIFSATQLSKLLQKIQAQLKQSIILEAIGNIFFIFCLGHWAVCAWIFLTYHCEKYFAMNWQIYQKYNAESAVWEVYNHSWYAIANIVAAVGSGDIFGTTDLERMFFVCLMSCADVIFALAFGLIADLTSSQRSDNEEQNFLSDLQVCERIMKEAQLNENWVGRVQQLMMFKYQLKDSYNNLSAEQLGYLPDCIAKEILYVFNRDFMQKLFGQTNSENLLRHLSYLTKIKIQIPDDIILEQGEVPTFISQIVLGSCTIINKRQRVLNTLTVGTIIGDIGKRSGHAIRAETHMLLRQISVQDIYAALKEHPSLNQQQQGFTVSQIVLGSVQNSDSSNVESSENEDVFEIASVNNPPVRMQRRSTFQAEPIEFRQLLDKQQDRRPSVFSDQENLASLVMAQYKKKPEKRLSQVSLGSQLAIQQNSGRNVAIDLI